MKDEMPSVRILGNRLHILDYGMALSLFRKWVSQGGSHQVCIANVHTTVMGKNDVEFLQITNSASLTTIDGQPLVWVAHAKGCKGATRVTGPDLLDRVCQVSVEEGYRHFFYGGSEEVANEIKRQLEHRYPGIQVVGAYSPPFRELNEEEDQADVDMINSVAPHFLWVGLGAPKQEKWIYTHLDRLHVPVQIGVGAAFDFLTGRINRAPNWAQKMGLEWLFRLGQDPKRLWRRYLVYNTKFIAGVVVEQWRK